MPVKNITFSCVDCEKDFKREFEHKLSFHLPYWNEINPKKATIYQVPDGEGGGSIYLSSTCPSCKKEVKIEIYMT